MYNFRYHLITIVAIFISLFIGLLLGAAIAGSDLARNTGNNVVNSLTQRFDDLSEENASLSRSFDTENALALEYVNAWAGKRLEGRTIAFIATSADASSESLRGIPESLNLAGAATVRITVQEAALGTQNPETLALLQQLVPSVEGQRYEDVLVEELVAEWTYTYTADEPTPTDDLDLAALLNLSAEEAVPQTPLQQHIYAHYPLTRFLILSKIISIETNYTPLIDMKDPAPNTEELAALEFAAFWQIPYGVNGVINALTMTSGGEAVTADSLGIQIAQEFNERGSNKALPYPRWLKEGLSALVGTETTAAEANYYAILVEPDATKPVFASASQNQKLSRLTTATDADGRYNIIALLSGATGGTYGKDRPSAESFPSLPADKTGRIPFA